MRHHPGARPDSGILALPDGSTRGDAVVLESATLAVGKAVAMRAGRVWLCARTAKAERTKDLVELIKVRFPDHVAARRIDRQLADIADSVVERLRPLCEHEFGGLAENDKAAVLAEVVDTLQRADLSDDALLAADADPVKVSRTVRAGLPPVEKQLGATGADLRALVEHWHTAVRQSPELPCPPERLPSYEARLLARLEAAPHLRILAANPLLAAMLCALNLDREQLPRDRMGLYGAALDLLLETRDAKRDIPSFRALPLEHDQKIRILQDLAWQLSTSNRVELPRPVAERMIEEKLRSMPRVRAGAAAVLDVLLQRSGVLREPVPGRVDFVHRTVQEYLAAKQAADLGEIELLVTNAYRDAWRETVIMAAGHCNEPLRRDLIAGLLDRIDAEPRHARRLKLLMASCLETLPSIPRDLAAAIDRCLDDLVPPRDLRSARSLATAGEPVLSRLPETLDGLSAAAAQAAVRTAWLINGPEALDLLSRYATDKHWRAHGELNAAWDYFDPDEYAQLVLAKVPGYRGLTVRTAGQLAALHRLRPVSLLTFDNVVISDLGFLTEHAERLGVLSIFSREPVADLSALASLPKLRFLQLIFPELTSIDFVAALPPMQRIWLSQCGEVADYTALARHASLEELGLDGCEQLTSIEMLPLGQPRDSQSQRISTGLRIGSRCARRSSPDGPFPTGMPLGR